MSLQNYIGTHITDSPDATHQLASQLGTHLTGGEVVLLNGTLGAGKTHFVKGIAEALACDATEVTSPTFTLVNKYNGARLTLYHIDLYRLEPGFNAAAAVDLEELLTDLNAVIVIEWAERIAGYPLPQDATWHIDFTVVDDTTRRLQISVVDAAA